MCVQSTRKDTANAGLVSFHYFDRDSESPDGQMDKRDLEMHDITYYGLGTEHNKSKQQQKKEVNYIEVKKKRNITMFYWQSRKSPTALNIDICGVGQVSDVRHRNCIITVGIISVISSLNNYYIHVCYRSVDKKSCG